MADSAESYWSVSDDYLSSSNDDDLYSSTEDGPPPKNKQGYGPEIGANIAAFVQRIKQMAPMVSDIRFIGDSADKKLKRPDEYVVRLAQQPFDIVERRTAITLGSAPLVRYLI